MDETFKRIAERLSRKRQELQQHFESSETWESTTAELLDRVQRLKERLTPSMDQADAGNKRD